MTLYGCICAADTTGVNDRLLKAAPLHKSPTGNYNTKRTQSTVPAVQRYDSNENRNAIVFYKPITQYNPSI